MYRRRHITCHMYLNDDIFGAFCCSKNVVKNRRFLRGKKKFNMDPKKVSFRCVLVQTNSHKRICCCFLLIFYGGKWWKKLSNVISSQRSTQHQMEASVHCLSKYTHIDADGLIQRFTSQRRCSWGGRTFTHFSSGCEGRPTGDSRWRRR